MHEFSFATSIVEALLDLAQKQGASKILEVRLRIGALRALSVEQVSFSYNILSKGTLLEGSRLFVEESLGSVRCPDCGYHAAMQPDGDAFHFGIPTLLCPQCGGNLRIEGGDECTITSVKMLLPTKEKEVESTADG